MPAYWAGALCRDLNSSLTPIRYSISVHMSRRAGCYRLQYNSDTLVRNISREEQEIFEGELGGAFCFSPFGVVSTS